MYYGVEIYDQFIGKGEDMKIVDNLTTSNYQKGNNRKIKYIVIHYFGSLGTAKNISNYFKNPVAKSSAHYCVDEKDIIYRSVKMKILLGTVAQEEGINILNVEMLILLELK